MEGPGIKVTYKYVWLGLCALAFHIKKNNKIDPLRFKS